MRKKVEYKKNASETTKKISGAISYDQTSLGRQRRMSIGLRGQKRPIPKMGIGVNGYECTIAYYFSMASLLFLLFCYRFSVPSGFDV